MDMMYVFGNRPELMDEINTKHENSRYLPGITLPSTIVAYSSLEEALVDVNTVLLVVPTKAYRDVLQEMKKLSLNQLLGFMRAKELNTVRQNVFRK